MPQPSYVLTGASGFVGSRLERLIGQPCTRISLSREDWRERIEATGFAGATVMHLAGRAHQGGGAGDFHRDNVEKTALLAEAAARGGARRLVFLSSIKVNGEETTLRPFTPGDAPAPRDAYGRSKRDAERALHEVASRTALEVVIVRCPLVYGAPAKGHLATLLRACDSPLPLPFASVRNRRSFIALDDLCGALSLCATTDGVAGKTYIVAHPEPVSAPALIRSIRRSLGRPARLFRVPPAVLEAMAVPCGLGGHIKRLTRSLEADASLAERELGWRARTGLEQAVDEMVRAYRT